MLWKSLLVVGNMLILINLVQTKLTLEQVVILSRHSLRTPLAKNYYEMSPKVWPEWENMPGFLTAKGARLAGYMGSYFAAWLKMEGILPSDCPSEDDLYVFSNTAERTLTSAQSFVEKGFPGCRVNVHHTGLDVPNPVFNPIIHNSSATFKELAMEEMQEALNRVQLNDVYELLSNILDYKRSKACEMDEKCNLTADKNLISITPGYRPRVAGPLKIGNEVIDTFLMQKYEGFPTENVAWGQLNDANAWPMVIQLNDAYFNVTYKTRLVARDISRPMIQYISDIFVKDGNKPKVTLLFGHDVNFHTVFEALSVKPYSLENQDEIIPIGSAAVFQKWKDEESDTNYFKLTYVYQSTEQLRHGNILSLESPPQIKSLELENCKVDENCFCSWDDFKTLLRSL